MFRSVIETIFIFMVLSLLSRHFTKAEPQSLSDDFLKTHRRFHRFRRAVAAEDSVVFPKENISMPKTENAQSELPKPAIEGEVNKNGTDPNNVDSRFGFLGGGSPFRGIAQGLIGGLVNSFSQPNYGPEQFGGGGLGGIGGYNQYPGGYNQYPGVYNQYPGVYNQYPGQGFGGGYGGPVHGGPGYVGQGFGR